jgi:hypothetical protein
MEQSARKRWQPVVKRTGPKTAQTSDFATVGSHGNCFAAHGKEGVNGSSPLEGFKNVPPHVGAFSFRSTCTVGSAPPAFAAIPTLVGSAEKEAGRG